MNTKIAFALMLLVSSTTFAALGLRRTTSCVKLGLENKVGVSLADVLAPAPLEEQLSGLRELIVTALVMNDAEQRNFLLARLTEVCAVNNIDFKAQVVLIKSDAARVEAELPLF